MKSLQEFQREFQKLFFKILAIGFITISFSGCAAPIVLAAVGIGAVGGLTLLRHDRAQPNLTPLEIQSLQTRDYTASKEKIFSSVLSVFQDLGYTISTADVASGFIQAKSLLHSSDHINATAFIESEGNKTKVRLSFVKIEKISHPHRGSEKDSTQLLDATLYQNAFEHLESELFVRSSQ